MPAAEESTWYDKGLRFTCTQCGNCCTGPPGYVWFNEDEAKAMAGEFGLEVADFRKKYARRIFGKWTLNEVPNERGEFDCVFLNTDQQGKRTCMIYENRPTQCRTWPFWPENLKNGKAWQRAGQTCPGMTAGNEGQGQLYSIEQIRIIRDRNI